MLVLVCMSGKAPGHSSLIEAAARHVAYPLPVFNKKRNRKERQQKKVCEWKQFLLSSLE